jgi:superfamily II DNA or RNA helicase
MEIDFSHDDTNITLRLRGEKPGLLARLVGAPRKGKSFASLPESEQALIFALGDLRALEDQRPGEVDFGEEVVRMSHTVAASLSSSSAQALGLPPDVHLTLATDAAGTLGSADFRLTYEWRHMGQRQSPPRIGCLLSTSQGLRRVPFWMKQALDLADGFTASAPLEDHWAALATFRQALEPDEAIPNALPEGSRGARVAMTSFLRGLNVKLADCFSISPDANLSDFDILPFSGQHLEHAGIQDQDVSEANSELNGELRDAFQWKFRTRGACPAYQLAPNTYLVVDRAAMPVLAEMARAQRAPRGEREAFIRNPRAFLTRAVTEDLSSNGEFDQLSPAEQEEQIENIVGPSLLETREYSARVRGITTYIRSVRPVEGSGTTWMPEIFSPHVLQALASMPVEELNDLHQKMEQHVDEPGATITIAGESVDVTPDLVASVKAIHDQKLSAEKENAKREEPDAKTGPFILDAGDNYDQLGWAASIASRIPMVETRVPETIRTKLKPHQVDSFNWAAQAWQSGLPGILNADEQGLGKTLQTIAFLNWLQAHMRHPQAAKRGPILVVAPTSLLVNWEQEVERHVEPGKFGRLIRLYGGSIAASKRRGTRGVETDTGLPVLDLDWLDEAREDGRAHRFWVLTTYTTLTNYQHSLGTIPFSAVVFDEIQAAKNQDTIRSKSVAAVNADFRIGLTGTPIENSTLDLWTIMDRLAPGALGSGKEFKERYGTPTESNMLELHARVFKPQGTLPPLGLRRIKDEVAKDLPAKGRRLHPRQMPSLQAKEYGVARLKLASGGRGAALKMLHHIRSVSVHPGFDTGESIDKFVAVSARLQATMDILSRIKAAGERALVFIEHREVQFRFAEIVRQRFGLTRVEIINGDTPIAKRQKIVNEFQTHLADDRGFDLLILGPKAAGTGLTLTAATHVIHLSRWWNPAVEEQCNDRVHRIGQTKPVTVHVPMAIHGGFREYSFDCLLHNLMQRKRRIAAQALWPMGDTENDAAQLQSMLSSGRETSGGDAVDAAMAAMFVRDGLPLPPKETDGSLIV